MDSNTTTTQQSQSTQSTNVPRNPTEGKRPRKPNRAAQVAQQGVDSLAEGSERIQRPSKRTPRPSDDNSWRSAPEADTSQVQRNPRRQRFAAGLTKPEQSSSQQSSGTPSSNDAPISSSAPTPVNQPRSNRRPIQARASASDLKDGQSTADRPTASRRPHPSRGKQRADQNPNTPGENSEKRPRRQHGGQHQKTLHPSEPVHDDLTSTLIHALRTAPYPDCVICFSPIRPSDSTWSCSPSLPIILSEESGSNSVQYCWNTFHLKCIRSWAEKNVKDVGNAWIARGETGKVGDWRCPGCQAKRELLPLEYRCFCDSTRDPKPPRLATPHSCGNPCARSRDSGCGHPCPLNCHPGPCPPCQITTTAQCYCARKQPLVFRCGADNPRTRNLTCGEVCGRLLACGKHECQKICHRGDCDECEVKEVAKCWCGKTEKEVDCGYGKEIECAIIEDGKESKWVGRFGCAKTCDRLFDCGEHTCQQPCHAPSPTPAHCPFSPDVVTHCPCGSRSIARTSPPPSSGSSISSTRTGPFPARTACTSPIPTCDSTCSKPNTNCGHPCTSRCHVGPCPPCRVEITRPCRCGKTTRGVKCFELWKADSVESDGREKVANEILCEKRCTARRACGRHVCNRVCCPLASFASSGKKGKKGVASVPASAGVEQGGTGLGEERGGLHECDLICGKMLECGQHPCEERDHAGQCPPCLRSSFEEMICACGRTVLEPPIPCGTRMQCQYPCARPAPSCGHPPTIHSCHGDDVACPPCVHLTTKECACGKKEVVNIKCSLEKEKVSCGTACGKLMNCGFHHCERTCHADPCGPCTSLCGKSRKLCLPQHHPCTLPCHAPSACPEDEPCPAFTDLTCPCGRISHPVKCARSSTSLTGPERTQHCTSECALAKRNARLAEALGINVGDKDKVGTAVYEDELVGFGRVDSRFLGLVEKAFSDFVSSEKRRHVLPHMPPERRRFVQGLAKVYRMDTQLVDPEPHRSVELIRRIDTRIPTPLLSAHLSSSVQSSKLVDMRNSHIASPIPQVRHHPVLRTGSPSGSTATTTTPRGWTAIVANSNSNSPSSNVNMGDARSASASGLGGSRPVVRGNSPAVVVSRVQTPVVKNVVEVPVVQEDVPDDWEDDV